MLFDHWVSIFTRTSLEEAEGFASAQLGEVHRLERDSSRNQLELQLHPCVLDPAVQAGTPM
jgi:hypothetical protein